MKRKNYRELHIRKTRGGKGGYSEKILISKAEKLFLKIKNENIIKQDGENISIRVDLSGTPEVSFVFGIRNGELFFTPGKQNADVAVGMMKEHFVKLVDNPPDYGNMEKILYDNIFLKRGSKREFLRLRPLIGTLLWSKS